MRMQGNDLARRGHVESPLTTLELADGRSVEVLIQGEPSSPAIVFFGGTPCAAVAYQPLEEAAQRHDRQLISYSRPGYGLSSPLLGRDIAAVADDTEQILDALDVGEFVGLGWSGGGPHALAAASLLGSRCVAAATIASVAPVELLGDRHLLGMGSENVREVRLAQGDGRSLERHLEELATLYRGASPSDVAALLGDTLTSEDEAALDRPMAEFILALWQRAVLNGISGWLTDSMAFVRPWGFDVGSIDRPVHVWHGTCDRMVPIAHGEVLSAATSGRLYPIYGEGHLRPMHASWLNHIVEHLLA